MKACMWTSLNILDESEAYTSSCSRHVDPRPSSIQYMNPQDSFGVSRLPAASCDLFHHQVDLRVRSLCGTFMHQL